MGRRTIIVDKGALERAIQTAEKDGPLATQNDVWKTAADIYNAGKVPEKISFSVVTLRAKQWGLKVKTSSARGKGKPMSDEHKAALLAGRGKRMSKAEKFEASDDATAHFEVMRKFVPSRYHTLIDAMERGSRTAAAKLNCLACMGFEDGCSAAIRNCTGGKVCPMYMFRPYQGKDGLRELETETVEVESEVGKTVFTAA
jgi:hypothetical protein